MANPSKRKGTQFEVEVAKAFNALGHEAVRNAPAGSNDIGDLLIRVKKGLKDIKVIAECKATKSLDLASGVNEANKEANTYAGTHPFDSVFSIAVFKRRQKSIAGAYVVMTLDEFMSLLAEIE